MLNGWFDFNAGAVLWANAATLAHNHSAQTSISARRTKTTALPVLYN